MKTFSFIILLMITNHSVLSYQNNRPARGKRSFTLINNKAHMPVYVRGNAESETIIVFIHGGPGGTSLKKIGTRAFNELEKENLVIYWEQRGSVSSKGGKKKKYLTINQFVDDLDQLVDQLTINFPGFKIFLMGHCWGGALGTAYLIDSTRQAKISGWIEIGGSHENRKSDSLAAEWVKATARQQLAAGKSARYWQRALNWYNKNPQFKSSALKHYSYVRRAKGYQNIKHDTLGIAAGYTPIDLLKNPLLYIRYYANYFIVLKRFVITDINLMNQLHKIKIPALLLWGEKDGLVPVSIGFETYRELGTADSLKNLVVINDVAHSVSYESPLLFSKTISIFTKGPNAVKQMPGKKLSSFESPVLIE
jgi:pimeloyl-ACP methyl ester carboxylesterase